MTDNFGGGLAGRAGARITPFMAYLDDKAYADASTLYCLCWLAKAFGLGIVIAAFSLAMMVVVPAARGFWAIKRVWA